MVPSLLLKKCRWGDTRECWEECRIQDLQPRSHQPLQTSCPAHHAHQGPLPQIDQVRWGVSDGSNVTDQSCQQSDPGLHWDNTSPWWTWTRADLKKKTNPALLQFPVQMISQGTHMAFVKAHEHLLILFPFHLLLSQCHMSPKGRLQPRLWTGSYTSHFVCSFSSCTSIRSKSFSFHNDLWTTEKKN